MAGLEFVSLLGKPPSSEIAFGSFVATRPGLVEDPDELLARARFDASGAEAGIVVALGDGRPPGSVDALVSHRSDKVLVRGVAVFGTLGRLKNA